jgi:uncharacterized protein
MKFESLTGDGARSLSTPGLYIEWRTDALARRHTLPTGVPAFVGFVSADAWSPDAPVTFRFDRWERFAHVFGQPRVHASPLLMHAVRGFFENGGGRCLIVPLRADYAKGDARTLAAQLSAPFEADGLLDGIEEIDLVCVPDAMSPAVTAERGAVLDVQISAVEHCARMGNRFAVLDAISTGHEGNEGTRAQRLDRSMSAVISQWQMLPAEHGALYFPWIDVKPLAPDARNPTERVPPCGHVAGVMSRCDQRVGVHKPPANEVLEGALDLDFDLSDGEQAALNQAGVNCLRERAGWGLRIWGARTLSDRPQMRYVNVTRVMLTVTRELEYRLRDLVFEPNGPALWAGIEERLQCYLNDVYRSGALKGANARDAYFVKCDAETNPAEARDAGQVKAIVGIAPAAPAEFVIVRITLSADGVSVAGAQAQF